VNETHYFFSGGKDKVVKYWDGDSYQLVMQFDECISEITCMAVGVIGDIFFVGGQDRIIRKYR
jgi:U3 small nucleolar RNA-associated protein 12